MGLITNLAPNSLESFAKTAEAVAATTKKLEKAALLGVYFQQLNDDDLTRATRYFAGQLFALSDARTTNVGGSILSEAICVAASASRESLGARYARWGDIGDVAFELFIEAKPQNQPTLTLAETEDILAQLSLTRGKKAKTEILTAALSKATPLEAKYLVKLLSGDLRIGLREGLVEDAIARAFKRPLSEVAMANMLRGDIGEAAVRARAGALQDVEMRLFHPLKFMLATPASDLADIARTMPDEFFVEDKFDGIRAQAHVQNGHVAIFSRTLDEISIRFPELRGPLAALPADSILDGEIISARGEEILPFSDLQKRLGRKTVSYKPGRRGREWLKLKKALATLDVVVTTVELGHGKRHRVLSDYTFAVRRSEDDPELLNIGKAYSGLTDAEIAEMTEWFRAHTIREFAHGRVRVVEPSIVIEVTFDRVQPSDRHKSGYALRFPRIVRLRPDKSGDEIDTLETVQKLAQT